MVICQRENLYKFFPKILREKDLSFEKCSKFQKKIYVILLLEIVSRNTSKRHLGCGVMVSFGFVIGIWQHTQILSVIKLLYYSWSRLIRDHVVNSSKNPLVIRKSKFRCEKNKFWVLPIYIYAYRICLTFKIFNKNKVINPNPPEARGIVYYKCDISHFDN